MTKIKLAFISAAAVLAVSAAFATRPCRSCETAPQYYKWGTVYVPAGQYGTDYICDGDIGICTYYRPDPAQPGLYIPCRQGYFDYVY